jgi:hypothetical protein
VWSATWPSVSIALRASAKSSSARARTAQNRGTADGDEIELVVYGRSGRYAARDVVDLNAAAEAVREFLRSGRPHPDHTWRP